MQIAGIVVHHSVCPAINGKGFDFYIAKSGSIIPSPHRTDPDYIHICLEGNFDDPQASLEPDTKEQLFLLQKLAARLYVKLGIVPVELHPHSERCPGKYFPWSELVISGQDGYH